MRLFPLLAVLASAMLVLSPAQAQTPAGAAPAAPFARLWLFNYSDKAVRFAFRDGEPAVSIPPNRIVYVPIPAQLSYFKVETAGMNDIDDNHYFENLAEVGGERWSCVILDVERGEYYHPRLTYMGIDDCRQTISERLGRQ